MFLTDLRLTPIENGKWRLVDTLDYGTADGFLIRIPKGFKTDLASIPRLLRPLFQVNGNHRQAAVLHDYLYAKKGRLLVIKKTRAECDLMFFKAMLQSGVPVWKARLMYFGVRVGGWASWG
jgi:hypothetical protein